MVIDPLWFLLLSEVFINLSAGWIAAVIKVDVLDANARALIAFSLSVIALLLAFQLLNR